MPGLPGAGHRREQLLPSWGVQVDRSVLRATESTKFAGVGIANAVAALGFSLAQRTGLGAEVWILFPMVVAAFQGACWFLAALVTRRLWTAVIAAGWYLSVLVLALLISMVWAYMLVLGAVLLLLMALPGWILIRSASNP